MDVASCHSLLRFLSDHRTRRIFRADLGTDDVAQDDLLYGDIRLCPACVYE